MYNKKLSGSLGLRFIKPTYSYYNYPQIKTQDRLGTYVDNLSEISVKNPKDLIGLYEQGI